MSVLARLAQRALGTAAPVRARLGGRFDGAGPAIDPEVPPEEDVSIATRAPATAAARAPVRREPGRADAPDRVVSAGPARPLPPSPTDVAIDRIEIGEQVEALMRTAAVAVDEPVRGVGGRDDAVAIDRHEDVAASRAAAPIVTLPEPFRPLLPSVGASRSTAAPRPLGPAIPSADTRDIRISIGRIEVRGEPARRGPAPPAAPPPSKLMSLEDYLGKAQRR